MPTASLVRPFCLPVRLTLPSALPRPCVVLFVADVARVSAFYGELARMSILHEETSHAVLAIDGMELVIHRLPPDSTDPSAPITVRDDSYTKLCLPVPRIAIARETAKRLGGAIAPPDQEWESRGFRACDGYDPEGNVIQVRETAGPSSPG